MSNVMFLFQKMLITTEILDMCVTYKRNATFNEKLNELRVVIRNGNSVKKYPKKV